MDGFAPRGGLGPRQDEPAARPGASAGGPFPGTGQPAGFLSGQPGGSSGMPQQPQDQYPPYRQGAFPESAQFPAATRALPASSAPWFPNAPQPPGGQQFNGGPLPAGGTQFPEEARFPDRPEFPGGLQYPDGLRSPQEPQYRDGPQYPDAPQSARRPQFPDGPRFPNSPEFPDRPQFADEQQFQRTALAPGQPQPGFDQPFIPNGPGGYDGPDGPGGLTGPSEPGRPSGYAEPGGPGSQAGPGQGRHRVSDPFARLALTPRAGVTAGSRARDAGSWDEDDASRPDAYADPYFPEDDASRSDAYGNPYFPEDAGPPARGRAAKPSNKNRNRALVAGAGVLAAIAIVGVILAPKVLGPSDPGCKAYAGPALTAYDKTINDLNAQASQSQLSADMSAAVSELTTAAAEAKGSSVKSALNGLLAELRTVQTEVAAGAVPTATVNALNAASTTADSAC
jgi:hypothetical protein